MEALFASLPRVAATRSRAVPATILAELEHRELRSCLVDVKKNDNILVYMMYVIYV